ncbi:DNA-binding domain-containing protein [Cupriavidus sp. P-10]|nr:DNA-binding domain-containing protein [Cupriavidus sp. P-10]
MPDVVEDMLTMVGLGGASADKHAKEIPAQVLDAPIPATAATSLPPPVPAPAPVSSAAKPSGEHFMAWLKQGIASRRLIINDAKALVHTVSDTAYLVSPGVFQRYAQEHPQVGTLARQESQQDWQWMQKRFERLHLHRKQPNGLDIWSCEVTGPRKSRRLHGYLLEDARLLFSETPPNNPYLSLLALASPDLN